MTSVGVMASSVNIGDCTAVLAEPFTNFTANGWVLTGTPTIVTGRTGTAAQFFSTTQRVDYNLAALAQSDTITVGFAWRRTDTGTGGRAICHLYSDSGVTQHNRFEWIGTTNTLQVTRFGTVIASTTFTFTQNTWYYLELQVKLHDTAGFVIVRVNGTEVINTTGLDTKNVGTKTVYDQLRVLCGLTSATNQVDDLYLSTGAGCPFQGDHTIP
jgi:hypothetical protein